MTVAEIFPSTLTVNCDDLSAVCVLKTFESIRRFGCGESKCNETRESQDDLFIEVVSQVNTKLLSEDLRLNFHDEK